MTVRVLGGLVVPKPWVPKVTAEGYTVTSELLPAMAILICCGLLVALSVRKSVPVVEPVAVWVKVTLIVQLAPAASEAPQLLDALKAGPDVFMRVIDSGAAPRLLKVMD